MKRSELFFAFILVPLDVMMILSSFVIAYHLRANLESAPVFFDIGVSEYLRYAIYLIPVWIALFAFNGLYSIKSNSGIFAEIYKILISSGTAMLLFVMILFFSKSLFFSRLILLFTWGISFLMITLGRVVLKTIQQWLLIKFKIGCRKVLLVGNNATALDIADYLRRSHRAGYEVIGMISDRDGQKEVGIKYLGDLENINLVSKKYDVDEIILTDMSISKQQMMLIMRHCVDSNISFKYIPDIIGLVSSNLRPGLIGSIPVIELKQSSLSGWGRIIKRLFDITFSFLALLALSPILLITAILVKFTSKGPILYTHERVGRDEKVFTFYKFRSMYFDKSDYQGGVQWTTKEDEKTRITPFGKIIRKTNLDELPQLWNIFIGDMSFVGPRPELPKLVEKFEKEIPEYFRRSRVKSGLTGWAQVNGLKGDTSIKERVRYDIYYIENWSLWFDFKIILKTIGLVIYEVFNGKFEYRSRSRVAD